MTLPASRPDRDRCDLRCGRALAASVWCTRHAAGQVSWVECGIGPFPWHNLLKVPLFRGRSIDQRLLNEKANLP